LKYYQSNIEAVCKQLNTLPDTGLSDDEIRSRLNKYGYNRIKKTNRRSIVKVFLEQFSNLLVIMLIVAAGISFFLSSYRDAIILLLVIMFNAFVGFYQDWKSENILASIKDLVIDKCYAIRNGKKIEIPAQELVPGDIVSLNEGDGVPADIRLINGTGFFTNDFIITGESQPKEKKSSFATTETLSLAEQNNCVFMGTTIAKGEATGVVIATGMATELGKIAGKSESITASVTPLQKELNIVAKKISYISLALATLLLIIKLLLGDKINDALIFTIGKK
jgi:Ca2+-transporting ATPase